MIRITKLSAAIIFTTAILTMLFILFVFPLLSDGYRETSLFLTIIVLSVLVFCFERLVNLFKSDRQNEKKLRIFYN